MAVPKSVFPKDERVFDKIKELRNTITEAKHELAFLCAQHLMTLVAATFDVAVSDITSDCRRAAVVRARFAYCLYRYNSNIKITAIADEVCKDHSTVSHAVRKAKNLLIFDSEFLSDYNKIKRDYEA